MLSFSPLIANSLWLSASWAEYLRFQQATKSVARTQERILQGYLKSNQDTVFGKKFHFRKIRSVADFQKHIPLSTSEDYRPYLDQIVAGGPKILTSEPVLLLEPTSGSTAATKFIPYTATLKKEFQRALGAWITNLFWHRPRLMNGQAYWSVSPVLQSNRRTAGGIPIGFEDDSEYLGKWQKYFQQSLMAVPSSIKFIDDMNAFRYITLLFLLRAKSLKLISVWNPTFLTLLIENLSEWSESLINDIAGGTIAPPNKIAGETLARIERDNFPNKNRAEELRNIFSTCRNREDLHKRIWPELQLISCWTQAQSVRAAQALKNLFPTIEIQGKGLLATEGFVSFPLIEQSASALAIRSHFFEFLPLLNDNEFDDSRPQPAHQLEIGQRYSVVLTTGGGLYRYRLNDAIEVTGKYRECPMIRFLGKAAQVSDWFGEKLNEFHVAQILEETLGTCRVTASFAMLAGEIEIPRPAYILFIESDQISDETLLKICGNIEAALQKNFHYRYCRELEQLAPLQVFRINSGAGETYLKVCRQSGQRIGDIKPTALHRKSGWAQAFNGYFVQKPSI